MIVYTSFWAISLCLGFLVKRKISSLLFFFGVFLFVGLRMETGFDWPVYKDAFDFFRDGFSWSKIAILQLQHSQETGFLLILGLLGQVIANYEVNQALFTLFFLYSFYKLSMTMHGARPALALAIYFSFFLLAVGFSTVRQALAISFFNMALYQFFREKSSRTTYFYAAAAIAVHLSASIYVILFLLSLLLTRLVGRVRLPLHLMGSFGLLLGLPSAFALVSALVPQIMERVSHYENLTLISTPNLFSFAFSLVLLLMGALVAFHRQGEASLNSAKPVFGNLIVLFSAVSFASLFFTTLRDRLAYELVLLFSIYISAQMKPRNLTASVFVALFGLYYQLSILRPPRDLAFLPYQNSLILFLTATESTGEQRSSQYMEIFIEDLAK